MTSRHQSPTEDAVDRYNHTWGVVLLLTISATTWLLPQLPYVQQSLADDAADSRNVPRFAASCWTPIQFTGVMVSYVHATCGAAFNNAIKNVEDVSNETLQPATLHYYQNPPGQAPGPQESIRFRTITAEQTTKQEHNRPAMTRIYSRIPLITFILAVCLKLPYIIWSLLSSWSETGPSQILRSIQAAQFLDAGTRNQTHQEIIQAISLSKQRQSFSSSVLYLSFKLLTIIVTVVGFFVVKSQLSPKSGTFDNGAGVSTVSDYSNYSNTILICDLPVVQLQSLQKYSIQCVFYPETRSSDTSKSPDTAEHDFVYVRLFDVLHTILALFFAVLAALNALNFLVWVATLAPGPVRKRTFSTSQLPVDVYLLLLMVRQNVGFLAANNLELGLSSGFRGSAKAGEELRSLTE